MHGLITGGVEEGESYEDAAKREIYEENWALSGRRDTREKRG